MKKRILLFAAVVLGAAAAFAQGEAPAFPGAEGHGRYVTGGRGGEIRYVTNLNNSGTGSFRAAVSGSTKKIVVFKVGGVIPLTSDLTIGANTTIAGQTAPFPGITLRYRTLRISNNVIIRFIRSRRGQEKDHNDGADAIWDREKTGVIFDHCSFSWSIDEVASFYDNNNFTMQWCTIAESLNNAGHGKGAHGYGGIWGGKLASFHHNLIAHTSNRSPRFNGARYGWTGYRSNYLYDEYQWANPTQAENVDFRNCVMYNNAGDCYGGPGGGQINIVNNYYKGGPATSKSKAQRVTLVTVSTESNSDDEHPEYYGMTSRYYISGNTTETNASDGSVITENRDWNGVSYDSGTQNADGSRWSKDVNNFYDASVPRKTFNGESYIRIKMDEPGPAGEVTTHSASIAFEKVLTYAGASLDRDDVDARYMEEARTGTATYTGSVTKKPGLIDLVSDVEGYTEANFPTGQREDGFDSDKDGMPDYWETANGLNPNDASDANLYTIDTERGWYTNIEVYLNSLVEPIVKAQNADALTAVDEYYPQYVPATTGIEGAPVVSSEVAKIEYYTLGGAKVSSPIRGISIRKITYTDGRVATDKIIK